MVEGKIIRLFREIMLPFWEKNAIDWEIISIVWENNAILWEINPHVAVIHTENNKKPGSLHLPVCIFYFLLLISQ